MTVYLPGCWHADDDYALLVQTHGASSSIRTVGLGDHEACSRSWRLRRLSSRWTQQHRQDALQAGWAAEDILTAAAGRRVLDASCAGAEPMRLVQHAASGGANSSSSSSSATVTAAHLMGCLLYTSPSPRDGLLSRMPSSA